jgi:hypothetical protein
MVKIMRKVIIFFYLIGIYGCFCQTQKHNYQVQEKFLKNFYFEYLIKTDIDKYDKVVISQNYQKIMNAYCTENLVNKINGMQENYELSYDPFIKAQDYHISLLDFIIIKKNHIKKGNYLVSYRYKNQSEKERINIDIQVAKVNGNLKIIGVDNIN